MTTPTSPPPLDGAFSQAVHHELGHAGPQLIGLFVVVLGVAALGRALQPLLWSPRSRFPRRMDLRTAKRFAGHQLHLRRAQAALGKLRALDPKANPAIAFRFLRAVPGFVFEEMILLELCRRGLKCRRSQRYTGDGGKDGEFLLNAQRWLVQAKCYTGPVRAEDVWHFNQLCEEEDAQGLFIHTGRTTDCVWRKADQAERVTILSGARMLEFFAGGALELAPRALQDDAPRARPPLPPPPRRSAAA